MIKFIVLAAFAIASCSSTNLRQCAYDRNGSVAVTISAGSALDGTDYKICSLLKSGKCSKYNTVSMLRPLQIDIDISPNDIKVFQRGGSVESFVTDPQGLLDSAYNISKPIAFNFAPDKGSSAPLRVSANGKAIKLGTCK